MLALGANGRGRAGLLSALRPQDVFATSLYTGTGASQPVTTGFPPDLAWRKIRSSAGNHTLQDRLRGQNFLSSNTTSAEAAISSTLDANGFTTTGISGETYVNWSFRRASKFFDIVTYTGDGTSGRVIPHALGIAPGLVIIKRRSAVSDWHVRHRSATGTLYLNQTTAQAASFDSITAVSDTTFTVEAGVGTNGSGSTYVAYLFAHDPDTTNGIVQCGSFTADGGGSAVISTGWPIQWLLFKASTTAENWSIVDAMRGMTSTSTPVLRPNTSAAEVQSAVSGAYLASNSTGAVGVNYFTPGQSYVFCAIRAPI